MTALIKAIITTPLSENFEDCLKHVLHVAVAVEPHFQCNIHGEVKGYFEIYDKKICGVCAANAIEKFIRDMTNTEGEHFNCSK